MRSRAKTTGRGKNRTIDVEEERIEQGGNRAGYGRLNALPPPKGQEFRSILLSSEEILLQSLMTLIYEFITHRGKKAKLVI